MMVNAFACIILVLLIAPNEALIGINWGRANTQKLIPSTVVDLLLQNNIRAARIFTTELEILKAFVGSGIRLTTTIYDESSINSYEAAKSWILLRTKYLITANVRNIYIGSIFYKYYGSLNQSSIDASINALKWMQSALNEAGYGNQIKVSIPFPQSLLKPNITRPSQAEFKPEYKDAVVKIIRVLRDNNAPLAVDSFPAFFFQENTILDPEFTFLDNGNKYAIEDINGMVYTHIVEFVHDCFVWMLKKMDASNLEIVLSQVGWPTDGFHGASDLKAERFYKGLLPWVVSNKGTPMRPGRPLTVFIHSLTDENRLPSLFPFIRHCGIFSTYGEPKYKIDLSGLGRDIYPTKAKGIMSMPKRWCVFSGGTLDEMVVTQHFNEACLKADCTSLAPGGSCGGLTHVQNVSYAFNMYFQSLFQKEDGCDFDGLGKVVYDDPSIGECVFPVEVVKGQQKGSITTSDHTMPQNYAIILVLVSIIWNIHLGI